MEWNGKGMRVRMKTFLVMVWSIKEPQKRGKLYEFPVTGVICLAQAVGMRQKFATLSVIQTEAWKIQVNSR